MSFDFDSDIVTFQEKQPRHRRGYTDSHLDPFLDEYHHLCEDKLKKIAVSIMGQKCLTNQCSCTIKHNELGSKGAQHGLDNLF